MACLRGSSDYNPSSNHYGTIREASQLVLTSWLAGHNHFKGIIGDLSFYENLSNAQTLFVLGYFSNRIAGMQ
jgi:hypothetical protein